MAGTSLRWVRTQYSRLHYRPARPGDGSALDTYFRRTHGGAAETALWPICSIYASSHTIHATFCPIPLCRYSRVTIVARDTPFGYGGGCFPRSELRTGAVAILAQERRARGASEEIYRRFFPSLRPASQPRNEELLTQ